MIRMHSDPNELIHGLFGQSLTWVLECVLALESQNFSPEKVLWDIHTKAYGRIIPGVLNPIHQSPSIAAADSIIIDCNMVQFKHKYGQQLPLETASFAKAHEALAR